jgi:predicted DNA-binding transcriptional regulator
MGASMIGLSEQQDIIYRYITDTTHPGAIVEPPTLIARALNIHRGSVYSAVTELAHKGLLTKTLRPCGSTWIYYLALDADDTYVEQRSADNDELPPPDWRRVYALGY